MPRYDYVCQSCEHLFELRQGFDAETVATCPQCEGTAQRKIYAPPVVFKGSGFYVNDYGKGSSSTISSNGSSDSAKDESSSNSKSESSDTKSKSESSSTSSAKAESTTKPSKTD